MDIKNNGPVLDAGRYSMRITNVGVIGNAFFNNGLSFDPSFEFPKGSGQECLEHAELWVGAHHEDGTAGVSGGPALEWRPSLDPADVAHRRYAGDRGTRPTFDDDGDGRVDEEALDGLDNDGDGEVDEDLRFPAQETIASSYTDDTPEAIESGSAGGERHRPLALTVLQESHAWAVPGYGKLAGISFRITNHGRETLRDVFLGVYANLDARRRDDAGGHADDVVSTLSDSFTVFEGISRVRGQSSGVWVKPCSSVLGSEFLALHDARAESQLPWSAVVGMSHTTDPMQWLLNDAFLGTATARSLARAPRRDTTFRYQAFSLSLPPGQGGPPILDIDRYAALRGEYTAASTDRPRDYAVLVSCGPFARLGPNQSVEFSVVFIAGESADSLVQASQSARLAWRGRRLNLQPDATPNPNWLVGESGIQGHEICLAAPDDGVTFSYDQHCTSKFGLDPAYRPIPVELTPPPETIVEHFYRPGEPCVWTDLDCDACTGFDGTDTAVPWFVQAPAPPQPSMRVVPGDRRMAVEWDNLPEILADAGIIPGAPFRFWGYRVYRLDDWRRESLLPSSARWQQVASFATDTTLGASALAAAVDPSVPYDSIAYERRHFPVGHYRFVDERVLDGFDYHYVVTAVAQRTTDAQGTPLTEFFESPFRASFGGIVRARFEAGAPARDGRVWVVPNPFRARAEWEREPVPGDVFTRHVDFFGLPRAHSRIRIYTLAGDLVQELDHDGTTGNGQAPWNLISRNGQDIESGVYLFTVDSPVGHQTGKFVIMR